MFCRFISRLLLLLLFSSLGVASGITYHGRILRSNNSPLTSPNTRFKIEIRSPGAENCLLWQEEQTKDLSATNGTFSINISDSSDISTNYLRTDGYAWGLDRVFSNRAAFTSLTGCTIPSLYNPNAGDARVIRVSFKENPSDPTWEDIPLAKLNFVPMSFNTLNLEGFRSTEFLKMDSGASQTPLTIAQVNTLLQIVAGTTTLFVKPGDAAAGDLSGTFAAPVVDGIQNVPVLATAPVLNQVLKFNGTAWAPANEGMPGDASYAAKGAVQFLTDQATSGIQVAAGVVSLPNLITAGGPTGSAQIIPVITYDAKGRLTAVSTATVNDNTKLPLDGSVPMTGSLNMGNQNITNVNSVSSTSLGSRSLRLFDADNSNYVDLQTPSVVATNYVLTLPVDDGTAGQVLTTDGNGVLSWGAAGSGISVTANQAVISNGAGNGLVNFSCPLNQVFSFDGMGTPTCQAVTPAGGFINNGNSFAGNSTLGLNDSFDLNFETAGTTRMTLTAAGNVGIGVTNPSYLLQVSSSDETGAVEFRNNINPRGIAPVLTLSGSYSGGGGATGDGAGLVFKGETTSGTVHELGSLQMVLTDGTHSTRSGAMLFNTVNNASAASERMRITSAGNVGIGTTTPTQLLHVNGPMRLTASALPGTPAAGDIAVDSGDANKLKYYDGSAWQTAGGTSGSLPAAGGTAAAPGYAFSGDTNTGVFSSVADTIQFSTNSIERMRITSAGNVGIGTTNPGYLFDISNNAFNRFYVDQMGPGYTTVHAYGEGFGQFLASDKSDLSSHSFMFDGGGGGQSLWGTTRGTMNFIIGGNIYTAVDLTFSSDGTINTNGNIKSNAAAVPGIYGTGAFVAATSTANSGAGFYASANNSGTSWGGFGVGYGATPKWTFGISRNIADTTALIFTEDGNAANTRMTIGTGGNVGIGTSSPSARLDVRGTWPNHLLLGDAGNAGGLGFRRGSEGNVNAGIGLDSALGQDIEIWNSSGSGSVAHKLGAFYPLRTYLTDVNTNTTTELNSVLRINPPQVVPGVSGGGWSRIYFDAASGKLKVSENGGAYVDLVGGGSISGSGTTGRLPKFTSSSALGDSIMTDNGTNIEISSGIARLRLTPDAVGGHSEVRSTSGSSLNLVGGNGASQITVGWNGAITANTGASGNAFQVINSSDNIFRINSGDAAVWDFRANYASNNNLTLTPSVGGGNFIVSGANVGIGTTNPTAKLQVEGAIVSKPQAIASGGAVNLALSNTHTLSNIGGNIITLTNFSHGATYTILVTDPISRTYTFSGCTNSYFKPANAPTTTSSHTIYTIFVIIDDPITNCYINWATGYQ